VEKADLCDQRSGSTWQKYVLSDSSYCTKYEQKAEKLCDKYDLFFVAIITTQITPPYSHLNV